MKILSLIIFVLMCIFGGFASTSMTPAYLPGFWMGLIHGYTIPWTFLLSLFRGDIAIYAMVHNSHWYDFGFVFGIWLVYTSFRDRNDWR